jgi:hypothetical protein
MEHDYNICPDNEDGVHGPLVQNFDDYEISDGWVAIQCKACGVGTGVEIPPVSELEWN